ncbi:MAG: hypothetical protein KJP00_03590, partial [Bacteroidia bacterium]|nr:hypothetical protein [Bacteroidia bacterium]
MRLNDPSRKLTTDQLQQELQEMERAVAYYKKLSDEVAGYNILVDSRMILLKRELQQKNDGFSILSSLHKVIGTKVDLDELLQQTLHLILTTLKMDKAVILWRENDEPLLAKWHLGYNTEQIAQLKSQSFDDATLLHEEHILVNKASRPEEKIGKLLHSLELPFAVGIPLYDGKKVRGWMIGGRHKEAQPFYPPLSNGDLFTFHA